MNDALHPQLVDIGGRRLAVKDLGQGTPVVILEMGMAGTSQMYDHIAPKIAQWTRVIWYDRGGLGQSDPAPEPRTFRDRVEDLHTLLQRMQVSGPFVLAGHSMGGMLVRLYAACYPQEVAALLLIDAAHETQFVRLFAALPAAQPGERPWITEQRFLLSEKWKQPSNDERMDQVASFEQMRICTSLGNLPLVVISRGRTPSAREDAPQEILETWEHIWRQHQREQAALSTNSRHVIAENSGHLINEDEPELIIEEIRRIVSSLRK